MYLVPIAWLYVVVMMAAAEALAPNGTLLGAVMTLVLYGLLPLSVVMYIMGTPARRRARLRAEADADEAARVTAPPGGDAAPPGAGPQSATPPHGGGQAASAAVPAVREES